MVRGEQKRGTPKNTSELKTFEEIIVLFKALESMEEKVTNPELYVEEFFKSEENLQEVEHSK
jgi:hypothetical protein